MEIVRRFVGRWNTSKGQHATTRSGKAKSSGNRKRGTSHREQRQRLAHVPEVQSQTFTKGAGNGGHCFEHTVVVVVHVEPAVIPVVTVRVVVVAVAVAQKLSRRWSASKLTGLMSSG